MTTVHDCETDVSAVEAYAFGFHTVNLIDVRSRHVLAFGEVTRDADISHDLGLIVETNQGVEDVGVEGDAVDDGGD